MQVQLAVVSGPAKGRKFELETADRFVLGRAEDATLSLPNDPWVSREHFLIDVAPPRCRAVDLDSKNGLYVNGVRYGGRKPAPDGVKQAPNLARGVDLSDGDQISVGDTRLEIQIRHTQRDLETLTAGVDQILIAPKNR
jgi:pSer/pThr/pTyr-binding forkhead associated (FHA) protein